MDERRLKQVIINLLSNAVKFTPKGGIAIIVKPRTEQGQRILSISIKDTGLGITADDIPKLFKEFATLPTHQSVNPNGTGLGLYLSRNLVKLMNGNITVKSKYGSGSKFTIHLPLRDLPPETAVVPAAVTTTGSNKPVSESSPFPLLPVTISFHPPRILVVDDNEMNVLVVLSLLRKMGANCDRAANGQQAISMVREHVTDAYSVIFMDINMPVMCGDEATLRLRKMMQAGEVPRTPIVALSGEDREGMPDSGFDAACIVACIDCIW